MIVLNNVTKSYGRKKVLSNVSGRFDENMIHGILGPNGCGKTTLIKSMLGLIHTDSGNVELNGKDLRHCREQISWLPQHPEAPHNTTPQDLFDFIEGLRGTHADFREDLVREFEFGSELRKPLKALSGGNYQKCFLIATLMFSVPVIILDEPTVGLDPVAAAKFKKILRERSKNTTILLISHITSEIEQLSEKVHFLLEGQWAYNGSPQQLEVQTGCDDFESSLVKILSRKDASYEKV